MEPDNVRVRADNRYLPFRDGMGSHMPGVRSLQSMHSDLMSARNCVEPDNPALRTDLLASQCLPAPKPLSISVLLSDRAGMEPDNEAMRMPAMFDMGPGLEYVCV